MNSLARTTLRLTALVALALPAGAYAQGTREQQQACAPDAVKLCSDTIPDIPKTTACMKAHYAQLSSACQSAFNAATGGAAPSRAAERETPPPHREVTRREDVRREAARHPASRRETMRRESEERAASPARVAPEAQDAARDVAPAPAPGYPAFPSPDAPIVRPDASSTRSQVAQACREGLIDSFTCQNTVPSLFGER